MTGLIPLPVGGAAIDWPSWGERIARILPDTPTEQLPAAKDAIGRAHRIAQELGDREALVETSVADQRVKREIGKRHPAVQGHRTDLEPRQSVSEVGARTVSNYRADAEALTDDGFEQVAEAATETETTLDRATVRAAGAIEKAGGDPADAVRQPHVSRATGNPEWNTPPRILAAARQVLGAIDLDPASTAAANERVGAVRFLTAEDDALDPATLWMPEGPEGVHPDGCGGKVWLNPPYDAGLCAGFADRLLAEMEADHVDEALWLSNNATETKWAQGLLRVADALCFPAGRVRFLDSLGDEKLSPLQGQMVLYFGANVAEFTAAFSSIGVVWR